VVVDHLATTAARLAAGRGGWRRELADDPDRLAEEAVRLLGALDLVRVWAARDRAEEWWFSPATGRWAPVSSAGKT